MNLPLQLSASSLENPPLQPPKLLEQLRIHLRTRRYSIRTEQTYIDWARRFILFHGKRHPRDMGAAEVEAFLSYLAVERKVSASTQNQAKAALLYLYKQLLGVDLPWLDEVDNRTGRFIRHILGLAKPLSNLKFTVNRTKIREFYWIRLNLRVLFSRPIYVR